MSIESELQKTKARDELARNILSLLENDRRVDSAEFYGSIANNNADRYSDIDIRVHLSDVSDRAFAELLPDLIRPAGATLIDGWGLGALPDHYVRTIYFEEYPLFWHVDIECKSDYHIDGTDIQKTYHWPQIFKIWIDVVSNFLRGKDTTAYLEQFIGRWQDITSIQTLPQEEKLSTYLDWCVERARSRGAPCEAFYQRCDEVRQEYLMPSSTQPKFDINHYRQGYSMGVGGVVLRDDKVLLVRSASRRYAPTWSIPGGFVERDETMDIAVVREVKEETGVDAKVQGLIAARNRISEKENSAYFIFLLEADNQEPQADNVEVSDARYFSQAEIAQLDNLNPLTNLIVTQVFEKKHKLMTFTPHPDYPPSEYILFC